MFPSSIKARREPSRGCAYVIDFSRLMYSLESQLMGQVQVEDCKDEWGVVTTSKALTAQLKLRLGS